MQRTNITPTTKVHMKDHFTQANAVRDAVIDGDLQKMHAPATWLAEHKLSDILPEEWKPHIADMQNAGQLALDAADVEAAATAVADMARACGGCHEKLSGPTFTGESPAGEESSVVADMKRHRWAADRMWEGLVGPSDTAWRAGVDALVDAPLHAEAMADDKTLPKEVFDLAQQAHNIGEKGGTTTDAEARAVLYAEYVSACSGCHTQLGVVPPMQG